MIVYKIRRKSDGLFSSGGMEPTFSEKGKTWAQRGHLSNHFAQFNKSEINHVYGDCEVVVLEVIEEEVDVINVSDWSVTDKTLRSKQLQETRELEYEKQWKEKEIENLTIKLKQLKNSG